MDRLPPHLKPRETPLKQGEKWNRVMAVFKCEYCNHNWGSESGYKEILSTCPKCDEKTHTAIRSNLLGKLVGRIQSMQYTPELLKHKEDIRRGGQNRENTDRTT